MKVVVNDDSEERGVFRVRGQTFSRACQPNLNSHLNSPPSSGKRGIGSSSVITFVSTGLALSSRVEDVIHE